MPNFKTFKKIKNSVLADKLKSSFVQLNKKNVRNKKKEVVINFLFYLVTSISGLLQFFVDSNNSLTSTNFKNEQ